MWTMPGLHPGSILCRARLSRLVVRLLLGLTPAAIALLPAQAAPEGRRATLLAKRDETCVHQSRPDHMVSTDTVDFALPESDGAVKLEGSYRLTGSFGGSYRMSGRSVYQGEVRGDVLILRFGQWHFQGEPMPSSDPEMPSARKPVHIPLEPDAEVVIQFSGAHANKAPCSGTVVYRLSVAPEVQIWEVLLTGYRRVIHVTPEYLLKPETKEWFGFDYFHGVTFSYVLSAKFVIKKKKGVWQYESGTITDANVEYDYMQQPELYKVNRTRCATCSKVRELKGKPIAGDVLDNNSVILYWRDERPVVVVEAQLAVRCAPGPFKATCEGLRNFAKWEAEDQDFLQRAAGHVLPLKQGPVSFTVPPSDQALDAESTRTEDFSVVHEYERSRLE